VLFVRRFREKGASELFHEIELKTTNKLILINKLEKHNSNRVLIPIIDEITTSLHNKISKL
jgi:hypothetical protein